MYARAPCHLPLLVERLYLVSTARLCAAILSDEQYYNGWSLAALSVMMGSAVCTQ